MSTLKVLWQMPETKAQIKTFVASIKEEILNSGDDALKVLKQLKMVEKTLQVVLLDSDIEKHFVDIANKYHRDELENLYGAKFEIKDVGVKYDYLAAGDYELEKMEKDLQKLKDQIKDRKNQIKSIKQGEEMVCEDTGCVVTRPVRSAKTKVVVTL